jgi:poly-gamma-glutamate synthesis protein (capsule biosynthesis protein)
MLEDLSVGSIASIARSIRAHKREGDIAVVSLHWGPNWGFDISADERRFAHALLDQSGADLVHGHSSHHVKGIEVHNGKLILYGCGDLLTDYEGIGGSESYRGNLGLMYFPVVDASNGELRELTVTPTCMRRFRVNRANAEQAEWLRATLSREGTRLGSAAERQPDGTLRLSWA